MIYKSQDRREAHWIWYINMYSLILNTQPNDKSLIGDDHDI